MNRFRVVCGTTLLVISGLAMVITVALGAGRGLLVSLTMELDSWLILLTIYASYPLFMLLLLWPGSQSRFECWPLVIGGSLILGCAVYSWAMVVAAEPGAIPPLVMTWYGLLQTLVVAVLFIVLALIRLLHYRKLVVTE